MWPNIFLGILCQGRSLRRLRHCRSISRNLLPVSNCRCLSLKSRMEKQTLVVVSGNKKKLDELLLLLGDDFPYQLSGCPLDLPEYQGDAESITRSKCEAAAALVDGPVLVEDTSLEFTALQGLPGPYVKWFFDKIGPEGLHRMLLGWDDKSAVAVCTLALAPRRGEPLLVFRGEMEGKIVPPRGYDNFGWGACFQPNGLDMTVAEMPADIKHKVSHRAQAIRALKEHFRNLK